MRTGQKTCALKMYHFTVKRVREKHLAKRPVQWSVFVPVSVMEKIVERVETQGARTDQQRYKAYAVLKTQIDDARVKGANGPDEYGMRLLLAVRRTLEVTAPTRKKHKRISILTNPKMCCRLLRWSAG